VLARVQAVRLEVGAITGMWTARAASEVDAVRESGRSLDSQKGGCVESDPELLPSRGKYGLGETVVTQLVERALHPALLARKAGDLTEPQPE